MFRQSNKHIEGVSNVCKNNTEVCDWQLVGSMTESRMLAFVQEVICRVEIAASIGFRHNHSRKMCVADGPFAISKCEPQPCEWHHFQSGDESCMQILQLLVVAGMSTSQSLNGPTRMCAYIRHWQ